MILNILKELHSEKALKDYCSNQPHKLWHLVKKTNKPCLFAIGPNSKHFSRHLPANQDKKTKNKTQVHPHN